VVICFERGADLHMAQLMALPLTVSCFSKIQIGFTFLVPAHLGSPGQRAAKCVCVCVCVCVRACVRACVCADRWPVIVDKSCWAMAADRQCLTAWTDLNSANCRHLWRRNSPRHRQLHAARRFCLFDDFCDFCRCA